jgi:hypothetical protein
MTKDEKIRRAKAPHEEMGKVFLRCWERGGSAAALRLAQEMFWFSLDPTWSRVERVEKELRRLLG